MGQSHHGTLGETIQNCLQAYFLFAGLGKTVVVNILNMQVSATVTTDQLHGDDEFELACTSLGRRICRGHFVRYRETNAVATVATCRQMDKVALLVEPWRPMRVVENFQRSAYWSLVGRQEEYSLLQWPAELCEVALGWKEVDWGHLVLSTTESQPRSHVPRVSYNAPLRAFSV